MLEGPVWSLTGFKFHLWWIFKLGSHLFIQSILCNLYWCPHSVQGICCTWSSGMISFDLTGNQEKGLGKQWVEKLGQTTQWMMAGLYLSLGGCISLPVRTEPQTLAINNIWSWHGIKLIIFCQFMILTFQSLQMTDLPVLALLYCKSTHITHLYLITFFQMIFKPQF